MPQLAMHMEQYLEGIRLFNRGLFYEAHEALEDVWRAAPENERRFLQGLIQVAVALHHHGKGNPVGARSLLGRAVKNLSTYPEQFGGIQLGALRASLSQWQAAFTGDTAEPALPKLHGIAEW